MPPRTRLSTLPGAAVAAGHPDIRGWEVRTQDNRRVGQVTDLLVRTEPLRADALIVHLDPPSRPPSGDAEAVVALRYARWDAATQTVVLEELRAPPPDEVAEETRHAAPLDPEALGEGSAAALQPDMERRDTD